MPSSFPILPPSNGIQPVIIPLTLISQTGFVVTVTVPTSFAPDVADFCQLGDNVTIQAIDDTTWNGTWAVTSTPGNQTLTFTCNVSRTHTASTSGYIFFANASVNTLVPTGFIRGQRLTISGSDVAFYNNSWPCRYVTSQADGAEHIIYLGFVMPVVSSPLPYTGNGTLSATLSSPVTATLGAVPPSILTGGTSTLTWTSTGATTGLLSAVAVDGTASVTTVAVNGSRSVSPVVTTVYTFLALASDGSETATATVTIIDGPTATLTATPGAINLGDSATLTWTTTNAVSASIDQGIGAVALNGNRVVGPTVTTVYTLTAISGSGAVAKATAVVSLDGIMPVPPVLNSGAFKIMAMSSGGSYCELWVSDQDTGDVYTATAPDFANPTNNPPEYANAVQLVMPGVGFANPFGATGIVKDNNGDFWYASFGTGGGGPPIRINQLRFSPPVAPTYQSRIGWVATADSFLVGHEPSKAIDGNTGTYWENSGSGGTRWLAIDTKIAGNPIGFVSVRQAVVKNSPMSVYVSDDGASFTHVADFVLIADTSEQLAYLPVGTTGRYFKVQWTGTASISEINAGVTVGSTTDQVTFELGTQFTVWDSHFDSSFGFNSHPSGMQGFGYRSFDDKFIIASLHSVAAVDPVTQAISGAIFTMADVEVAPYNLHIAGISTNGFTLVAAKDNIYLLDSTQALVTHWTRAGIDPINSLFGPMGTVRWDAANNLLWTVTNDGALTRLFKIDLTGTGSIVASATIGVNEQWTIEFDTVNGTIIGVVGDNKSTGNDTELHVFDTTTLVDTPQVLPVNGTNFGNAGCLGSSQDGIAFLQLTAPVQPVAPIDGIVPGDGSIHSSSGVSGSLFNQHYNWRGAQFAFASGSPYVTGTAGPVIGPVTIVLTASGVAGVGSGSSLAMLLMPAFNAGDRRAQKRFGDLFIEAEVASGSAIFVNLWDSQYQTAVTGYSPTSLGTASGGLRSPYLIDFASGNGLLTTDLEAVISWPIGTGTSLVTWQPTVIEQPEGIQNRPTDWDDAGTLMAKFVQGVIIEADSFNVAKTFVVQSGDDRSFHSPSEVPATFNGQTIIPFSFSQPFIAHTLRIHSTDNVPWRIYSIKYVYKPYSENMVQWITEDVSHGLLGWQHIYMLNIAHISTADLILTLTLDGVRTLSVTVPNSGGVFTKTKVGPLPFNKFKTCSYRLTSAEPFRVFVRDLEVWIKQWGSTGPYSVLKPFGGDSSDGAEV